MNRTFERLAIVNRGLPASRGVAAARDLGRQQGTVLRTIAFYTPEDRDAAFVRDADESFSLGRSSDAGHAAFGARPRSPYVDLARVGEALQQTRADAAWVGWGPLAELASFAELCRELGVLFIGPGADTLALVSDKIATKRLAEQADVPVVPWSSGVVETLAEARLHASRVGFPLLVKSACGGDARAIRVVRATDELGEAVATVRAEANALFGDDRVLVESFLGGARHVEVPIVADAHGAVWALPSRDGTVQRRHRLVLVESPVYGLAPAEEARAGELAVRLAKAVAFAGVGTVEFLFDPATRALSFVEINPCLSPEHALTEATTGLDLALLQLRIARGETLDGAAPSAHGHAMGVRLRAEDPTEDFAPSARVLELLRFPQGPGLRVDAGYEQGDTVTPELDTSVAEIVATGRDRDEARARLLRAIEDTRIVLHGGASDKGFLLDVVRRPDVARGTTDVSWLDRLVATGEHASAHCAEVALLFASACAYEEEAAVEMRYFLRTASRGRPEAGKVEGHRVELACHGDTYSLRVARPSATHYRITADGHVFDVEVAAVGRSGHRLTVGERTYRVVSTTEGATHVVEVDGIAHRIVREGGSTLRAPAPAVVASIPVHPGDVVAAGDTVAVLEAMKMELAITAEAPGRVREVLTRPHAHVAAGAPLLVLDRPGAMAPSRPPPAPSCSRLAFGCLEAAPPSLPSSPWLKNFEELHSLVLGYDADVARLKKEAAAHGTLATGAAPADPELLAREDAVLEAFADQIALFRRVMGEPDVEEEDVRMSRTEYLVTFLRDPSSVAALPARFVETLRRALAHYGVTDLARTPALEEALFRMFRSLDRRAEQAALVMSVLQRRIDTADTLAVVVSDRFHHVLERLVVETSGESSPLHQVALEARFRFVEEPLLEQARAADFAEAASHLDALAGARVQAEPHVAALVACAQPLEAFLARHVSSANRALRRQMTEVLLRRYYRTKHLTSTSFVEVDGQWIGAADFDDESGAKTVLLAQVEQQGIPGAFATLLRAADAKARTRDVILEIHAWREREPGGRDVDARALAELLSGSSLPQFVQRVTVTLSSDSGRVRCFTFVPSEAGFHEDLRLRELHPMLAERLHLWRLSSFDLERLPSSDDVFLFRAIARANPKDDRLIALAEVRDLTQVRDAGGRLVALPHLERLVLEAVAGMRSFQSHRPPRERLYWNRIQLYVWPPLTLSVEELEAMSHRLGRATEGLGMDRVVLTANVLERGELVPRTIDFYSGDGKGISLKIRETPKAPMRTLGPYSQKVVRLQQQGLVYPYEIVAMVTPARDDVCGDFPPGEFIEHDLDGRGKLVPVDRARGENEANIVVGLIRNFTPKYPEGMTRVALLGDPSKDMGALAEPECRRIEAAIALARSMGVPLEWYALSAGARISMESGTENMDWIALVLRRLIEFTQSGGEVNVIVDGINVGAQPYWNAEATMLMHTRGILVMTARGAMVLTGKRALDFSGGVSADDNAGIGGYDRVMGPNGQAQYYAEDLAAACKILFRHYEHTYRAPGERFPRRGETSDPITRDVRESPHAPGFGFTRVGDVFSEEKNPARKKPFDVRSVLRAAVDQDREPLERWIGMREAENAVVWDAHIGGYPVCLLGIESKPLPRLGFAAADGPESFTGGTLFPLASKKIARAVNAASHSRPLVVLANLSGFDGSPESMRNLQLEYGAEIGRAVVNFRGPIVFCVVSRYHGGAFVVFSGKLSDNMEVVALEGTYASVIGGAPAAAVVFAREVDRRAKRDPRIAPLEQAIAQADGPEKVKLRARYDELFRTVHTETLGVVAREFDAVHTVQRAARVGSVDRIISAAELRPYLVAAIERGMRRELERQKA